jgi:ankyrin repeat protein
MTADLQDQVVGAIRAGDVTTVRQLLAEHPELTTARGQGGRTALHVVTDWPGYLPQAPAIARLLLDAGADPNARTEGDTGETPLHWAASNDDLEVAEVLVDAGADIEAANGSIGTPLANAVGYACWHVARLLVQRGARVETLWQAAALGLADRVQQLMSADPPPDAEAVTTAFWHACSGGQRRVAEYLLSHGADINGRPGYAKDNPVQAAASVDTRRDLLTTWLREKGGEPAGDS